MLLCDTCDAAGPECLSTFSKLHLGNFEVVIKWDTSRGFRGKRLQVSTGKMLMQPVRPCVDVAVVYGYTSTL